MGAPNALSTSTEPVAKRASNNNINPVIHQQSSDDLPRRGPPTLRWRFLRLTVRAIRVRSPPAPNGKCDRSTVYIWKCYFLSVEINQFWNRNRHRMCRIARLLVYFSPSPMLNRVLRDDWKVKSHSNRISKGDPVRPSSFDRQTDSITHIVTDFVYISVSIIISSQSAVGGPPNVAPTRRRARGTAGPSAGQRTVQKSNYCR